MSCSKPSSAPRSVYDALLLPALNYAERDRLEQRLSLDEETADILKSRGRVLIRRRQRALDFFERDLMRGKPRWVEHHFVLFLLAACGDHLRNAGNSQEAAPHHRLRNRTTLQPE
jgi:hypothetical protein